MPAARQQDGGDAPLDDSANWGSNLAGPEPFPEVAHVESPAGAIYIETPDSDHLVTVHDRLQKEALGTAESAELISAMAEEFQRYE